MLDGPRRSLARTRASGVGDFNPHRLEDWFPDEPVWLVSFGHDNVATLVSMHAEAIHVGSSAVPGERWCECKRRPARSSAVEIKHGVELLGMSTRRARLHYVAVVAIHLTAVIAIHLATASCGLR